MKSFGQLIRDALKSRGMLQNDLARQLGVSHTAVTMVLQGKMKLPPARLEQLFDALDVSGEERPLLRLHYLADIAPKPVVGEARGMCAALHSIQERAHLANDLLAAEEDFGKLKFEGAAGAKGTFLNQVLTLFSAAGLADDRIVRRLKARLGRAKTDEDYTRIAARMAVGVLASVREIRNKEALEDLRRLLHKSMVQRLVEVARQAASAHGRPGRRR